MFLDVFGVRRMLSRCVQMITNVGRWIFSRSSLGVLLMFLGYSQDFPLIFLGCSNGSCERGESGGSGLLGLVGLVGLLSLIGWVGLEGLVILVGIFFLFDLIQKCFQMELLSFMTHKNLMIPKPLVV